MAIYIVCKLYCFVFRFSEDLVMQVYDISTVVCLVLILCNMCELVLF